MNAQDIFDALSDPFPQEYLEWRLGSTNADKTKGMALAYIDARAVMDRLDTVCGPSGWQNHYSQGMGGSIICNIGVLMDEWIWKADGAGATDVEGEKGALSDAFKRAGVRWGIGRYLYDLKAPWVEIEPMGAKSHRIKDSERKKLDHVHEEFALKCGWGLRSGVQAYKLMNNAMKTWLTQPDDAVRFREQHASMIAQLPVGMRKHLNETLDRVGA